MNLKKSAFIALIFILLLSLSAASAADDSASDIISADDNELILEETTQEVSSDDELILEESSDISLTEQSDDKEILGGTDNGTFEALANKINNAQSGSTIILENDYIYGGESDNFSTIVIDKTLTIDGKGYTIYANRINYIFKISSNAIVTMKNLTFANITYPYSGGGAAIRNEGKLTIINSKFENNYAGGSVYNIGDLSINNSCFINNSAEYGGTIRNVGGTVTINNSCFINNSDRHSGVFNYYFGGAIRNDEGTVTINNSNLNNNLANIGGAIYNNDTLIISNSTFSNNSANLGGAVYNDGTVTISGSTISDNSANLGGAVYNDGTVTISGSTISGNSASQFGGAVYNEGTVTISGSSLNNNNALMNGGTVHNKGPLTINNSIIENNTSSNSGGAIDIYKTESQYKITISNNNFTNNTASHSGGAINIYQMNYENTTVNGNIFTDNKATDGSAIYVVCENGSLDVQDNDYIRNNYTLKIFKADPSMIVKGNAFEDIQAFVDYANEGDTIFLMDHVYFSIGNEIIVNKSLTFIGNNTVLDGHGLSAIFNITEAVHNITFKNIKFRQGQTEHHSLIYSESQNINIINCSFCDNDYDSNKSDVMINNSNANVIILNSSFYNNSQSFNSPNFALGALWINSSSAIIDNCVFKNNAQLRSASYPAALGCISEKIVLSNSIFSSNLARYMGAIAELSGQNITVLNCSFENNTKNNITDTSYNAVFLLSNEYNGIIWKNPVFHLENCTFRYNYLNSTSLSRSLYVQHTLGYGNNDSICNLTIKNCIFESNRGGLELSFCNNTILENCSFRNLTPDNHNTVVRLYSKNATITNCSFEDNAMESSIYLGEVENLKLQNTTFKNQLGAILSEYYANLNQSIIISNCSFINGTNKNEGTIRLVSPYSSILNTTITNCIFINNTANQGAAIHITNGYGVCANTLIKNCYFENNNAGEHGGAIYIETNTEGNLIDNCTFVNNKVIYNGVQNKGGALYLNSSNTLITNCKFENNSESYDHGFGAAIYAARDLNNISIINCNFTNNSGGLSAVYVHAHNCIMANCNFINNNASSSSAAALSGENWTVINCIIKNNFNFGSDAFGLGSNNGLIANCIFENNTVKCRGTGSEGSIGALSIGNYNATVENCSFTNNHVVGNHIVYAGAMCLSGGNHTVKNCNFANNSIENIEMDAATGGGALALFAENSTILNCIFTNNSVMGDIAGGGAICFFRANNSNVINCFFEDNVVKEGYEDCMGGGAICYRPAKDNYTFLIANSTFINNKVPGKYLNLTQSGTTLTVTLEGYEQYLQAISISELDGKNMNLVLSNVSYWDGEMLNTDNVPVVENHMGSNQPIVFEFYDPRGKLIENITRMTDSNGQASFNYKELPDGIYTYVVYHPDNGYYSYIKGGEDSFNLRASLNDLWEKINQASDSITLENDYMFNGDIEDGIIINKNITIYGNGHFISGLDAGRIFRVTDGVTLTLIDITLQNGYSEVEGGLINNYGGTTIIINSTLKDGYAINGGAIRNGNGTVTIINSTIENNEATNGGAIYNRNGTVTIINSTLMNNTADEGSAIWTRNGENVILDNVNFVDNEGDPIKSQNGEVDTTGVQYLTAVSFVIDEINDFLNGTSITITVRETLKKIDFYGDVTVSIGNNSYVIPISRGLGSKTVTPNLECGDYTAKLTFAKTDTYYSANASSNIFHVSNQPMIKLSVDDFETGSSFAIKVTAIHTFNGVVNVLIDGVNYAVNVANGSGSKTVSAALKPGAYYATITFAGNKDFSADTAACGFTVNKKTTSIASPAVTATYNVNKNLVATLKDKAGKAISGVKVTIKLSNGKTYTRTTDKNGQVKLAVGSLLPKTYTATITFAGNDLYLKSSKSVKVVVKKATPKMTAKAKTFKVKVKTKKYTITLKNNKGKVMKSKKVKLTVNKKTFTAKTNKKGVATFKITNLKKKGKFSAAIKYAGDKYYNKLTKKAKITIK